MPNMLDGIAAPGDSMKTEMAALRKKLVLAQTRIAELEKDERDYGKLRRRLEDILLDRDRLEKKLEEWDRIYDELACEYNRIVRSMGDDEYRRLFPAGL